MVYETLADRNLSEGFFEIFIYVNDITNGIFSAMILFMLFVIVSTGSYFSQRRVSGSANFPASFAIAGFFICGAAVLMSLIEGLMNTYILVITFAIAIIGALWLLFSRNQ